MEGKNNKEQILIKQKTNKSIVEKISIYKFSGKINKIENP